ncbi:helix-turn-helix domain-containing protein, partial [Mammaliicoccus sciuri]
MLKSRPINILNVFLNSKESVSAKELSIMFNKTERTIRNDLRDINEFLNTYEFLEINNQSGSFILNLTNSERVKLKEIVSGRVEEQTYNPVYRRAYILSHALMNHSHKKIYELCEDLQISKSTMDKDMKLLRQALDKYNLKIVSNVSTGLSIDGNEIDIRTFLYDYLVRRITEDKVVIDDLYDQYNPLVAYIGLNHINKIRDNYSKVIAIEQNDIKLSV